MNELYSVDGQIYEVSPENKDKFLNDFPNAELYKEQSDDQVKNTEQDQQGLEQTDFATDMLDPEDKILDDRAKETQAARDLMSSLNIPVMEAPKKQATIEPLSETEFYTGRMSKAELDKKAEQEARQKRIDTGQEQLSASESILNTLGNALNQLETVDDRAKYLYYFAGTFDFDTEEGKQRSEENRKKLLEIEGDLRRADLKTQPTIGFTDLSEREGLLEKGLGGVAAFTNAVTAFGTSALIAGTTGGVGLASEMVSTSVRDYNNNKAKEKGVEIGQLIKDGDAEVFIPAALGAAAYSLEKIGIKGVQKAINSKTTGVQNFLYSMLNTGSREGITEYNQFIIETFNDLLGKRAGTQEERQASILEISKEVVDKMTSREGLEVFLQGFAGGKGSFVIGRGIKSSFESRSPEVNKQIQQDIQQISNLEDIKHKRSLTDYDAETINRIQEGLRARVSSEVQNGNNTYSAMTEQDISSIEKSVNNVQNLGKQVIDIVNSKAFTEQEKETFTKPIRRKINKARNDINKIRSQAEQRYKEGLVAENVETVRPTAEKLGVEIQEFATKQEFAETTGQDANVDGFIQGDKIFINNQRAAEVGAISVGSHELLHRVINNKLSDADTRVRLATGLISVLRDEGNLDIVQQRIDNNYRYNEDGSQKELEEYAEEYFTVFSDAIVKGDIKYNDSLGARILETINSFINQFTPFKQAKFETGRQAYNFIKDYSKNIQQGRVTEQAVDLAGQQTAEVKKSITQADRTALGNQIKALVPPGTTKKQYDTQVIGDVYMDLIAGDRLNGLINNRLAEKGITGNDVFGKSKEIFIQEVKRRLYEGTIERFNPELNDDLGGFVVSELNFRIGDVYNEYERDTGGGRVGSLDIPVGETGSIRTPVADEADLDVETAEAPRSELKQGLRVDGEQFVDQKLEDEIEANTIEIVEGVTPEINDKDFKTFVKDAAQQKSFKSIKNKLKNLDKFLEDNINVLFGSKNLPIATLVAMERRTPAANRIFTGEPTRLTTQAQIDKAIDEGDFYVENEKQGPSKYPRKKPTIEEVKKFFFDVGASTKGTRKDGLVNAISFSLFRDIVPGVMNRVDIVQEDIAKVSAKLVVDPTIKFSKTVESNVQDILMLLNKYQRNEQDLTDQEKQIVEDYIGKIAIEEADKGKSAQQFTKSIKNSNLTDELKKGDWILSDKKFKENKQALNKFEKNANDVASQIFIPNDIKNKYKNILLGLFAGHYNIVGSEMAKVNSSFKQGILNSLNDSETSLLSEKTLNRWKNFNWNNLKSSYSYENITALKNIKNANSLSEQRKIANESFNTEEGKAQLELYDLWNTTLAEWLHSSDVNSKEFNDKADYILKLKKANSSIGTTGERILSPPGYVYLPGQAFTGTTKFEHLKSSSQQSLESAILVLNNKWKDQGKKGLKAYNGIFGLLDDFNIVDKQTGKVNDSNIFRFAENLELAKNIYSVESGFKQTLYDDIVKSVGKKAVKEFESDQKAIYKNNINSYPKQIKYSKSESNEKLLNDLNNYDQALRNARDLNARKKGISIFDFDDTLATSKSKVIVTVDGKTTKITPAEFAKQHSKLEEQGAEFDFSEFNKVIDGKPGPLAAKIKKAIDKFGNKDVFVLTARPQASAASIKAFLDGIGVNIPLENITGLEDGTPQAKANWVTGKAAEGYNDFYFTDDVYKNVKAVQDALEVLDVKSKTRLAYSDRVKKLDRDFNDIIEAKTGIAAEKEYSRAKAAVVGANKGKFTFFIPPSAEDFVGLLFNTL